MFNNGRTPKSISEYLGISTATIYRYIGDYQVGGVGNLLETHLHRCQKRVRMDTYNLWCVSF